MNFQEQLNLYLEILACGIKEVAAESGISAAAISRYRSGERTPLAEGEQLRRLAAGIASLAKQSGIPDLSEETVHSSLQNSLKQTSNQQEVFAKNFDLLCATLNLNMKNMANAMNYDPSFLYRIRSGQRHPNDSQHFVSTLSLYLFELLSMEEEGVVEPQVSEMLGNLEQLFTCSSDQLKELEKFRATLCTFLYLDHNLSQSENMEHFLTHLDSFNLDDFIREIHFQDLKVPTLPFALPSSKHYYGVEQMRQGELDFFRSTVLSKSMEPIFMCSDMPMQDMAKDMDFNKKWMFGIAMSLKKGLHLNIIHHLDRPFAELMLGLEAWIPIYMTGQVSPYYLKNISTEVYHHLHYASGSVALCGECVDGFYENGRYYLTNNKDEVCYYQKRAENLLQKASPLMEIYRETDCEKWAAFRDSEAERVGNRHQILTSLPIYTLSKAHLQEILEQKTIAPERKAIILDYWAREQGRFLERLTNYEVLDEVPLLQGERYEDDPMVLSLSDLFLEEEIVYSYEEYQMHLADTREMVLQQENYTCKWNEKPFFRNIQISISPDSYVVISKNKFPMIHFVIQHPTMVQALQHFEPQLPNE